MRWKPKELLYEMEQDPARRILFVEGYRDVAFWRAVGTDKNTDSVVYPIFNLDCEAGEGGERGRLLRSASLFETSAVRDRIRFFADADTDRVLQGATPSNVILTDGRDLESYALCPECLKHICVTCFPNTKETEDGLIEQIERVLRPIGILRITSARSGLALPFQATLHKRLNRFVDLVGSRFEVDLQRLIRTLLQNSHGLALLDEAQAEYQADVSALAGVANDQIVHGKDVAALLSLKFAVTQEEMERLLHMSVIMEKERVVSLPGVREAYNWLKQ